MSIIAIVNSFSGLKSIRGDLMSSSTNLAVNGSSSLPILMLRVLG